MDDADKTMLYRHFKTVTFDEALQFKGEHGVVCIWDVLDPLKLGEDTVAFVNAVETEDLGGYVRSMLNYKSLPKRLYGVYPQSDKSECSRLVSEMLRCFSSEHH